MRCPELFFAGASAWNSDSQYRSTYGCVSVISQTSPILKNSLLGICLSIGGRFRLFVDARVHRGHEEFRGPENDRAARADDHLLSSLRIAPTALPLLADQEGAEARDLDLFTIPQMPLDRLEDHFHEAGCLAVRNPPVAFVDDPRDVVFCHVVHRPAGRNIPTQTTLTRQTRMQYMRNSQKVSRTEKHADS